MKTRTKISAASILLGAVMLVFVGLRNGDTVSREIDGRPLEDWVRDLGVHSELAKSRAVLVRQGPVIIPDLIRSIRDTDRWSSRLQDAAARTRLGRSLEIKRYNRQSIRTWLFFVISDIGEQAKYSSKWNHEMRMAVDALLAEMENTPQAQSTVPFKLGCFGAHAKHALPKLIGMCTTNYPRHQVLHALAEIGPGEYSADVLAFATNFIASKDRVMSVCAIRALGACGSNGVAAMAQLLPLIADPRSPRGDAALFAIAQIGSIPAEAHPNLEKLLHVSNGSHSTSAALALLRLDTNATTARAIVESRLHPLVGTNLHIDIVTKVARIPEISRLFEPELRKLAAKTNLPSSDIARVALKRIAAAN